MEELEVGNFKGVKKRSKVQKKREDIRKHQSHRSYLGVGELRDKETLES